MRGGCSPLSPPGCCRTRWWVARWPGRCGPSSAASTSPPPSCAATRSTATSTSSSSPTSCPTCCSASASPIRLAILEGREHERFRSCRRRDRAGAQRPLGRLRRAAQVATAARRALTGSGTRRKRAATVCSSAGARLAACPGGLRCACVHLPGRRPHRARRLQGTADRCHEPGALPAQSLRLRGARRRDDLGAAVRPPRRGVRRHGGAAARRSAADRMALLGEQPLASLRRLVASARLADRRLLRRSLPLPPARGTGRRGAAHVARPLPRRLLPGHDVPPPGALAPRWRRSLRQRKDVVLRTPRAHLQNSYAATRESLTPFGARAYPALVVSNNASEQRSFGEEAGRMAAKKAAKKATAKKAGAKKAGAKKAGARRAAKSIRSAGPQKRTAAARKATTNPP